MLFTSEIFKIPWLVIITLLIKCYNLKTFVQKYNWAGLGILSQYGTDKNVIK